MQSNADLCEKFVTGCHRIAILISTSGAKASKVARAERISRSEDEFALAIQFKKGGGMRLQTSTAIG
jgi:hypothetical protein